ncbi:hypothetical protein F511_34014 [Dorcoceras hygrometricum]|uniref:Uncharacterized protein n=1 Tax=Dorcoceras hygrometricum TaxID=472368 RepID=A0A2Z7BJ51_9LAMI|nr:hypothetical protein F511_34014 [Dorcoceras hygrometricum]
MTQATLELINRCVVHQSNAIIGAVTTGYECLPPSCDGLTGPDDHGPMISRLIDRGDMMGNAKMLLKERKWEAEESPSSNMSPRKGMGNRGHLSRRGKGQRNGRCRSLHPCTLCLEFGGHGLERRSGQPPLPSPGRGCPDEARDEERRSLLIELEATRARVQISEAQAQQLDDQVSQPRGDNRDIQSEVLKLKEEIGTSWKLEKDEFLKANSYTEDEHLASFLDEVKVMEDMPEKGEMDEEDISGLEATTPSS